MRRKSVYYYLILSLTAPFFLAIAIRKPFADDRLSIVLNNAVGAIEAQINKGIVVDDNM